MPRGSLSRAAILKAALAVLEARGTEAVTIRNVAEALGTKPMSLYTHIADKEDLLSGMFEVILAEVEFPSSEAGTWQDRFRSAAAQYRQAWLRHPSAIPVVYPRLRLSSDWMRMTEWSLANLRNAGFDVETAVHAHRTLAAATLGCTLNEAWYRERTWTDQVFVPAAGMPTILEAAPYFAVPDFDAAFDFAIDTVIAGLERRLRGRR